MTAAGYTSMAEGMASESIVDPAGLNLKTVTAYEDPGDSTTGRFRRILRRTLPAGDPTEPLPPDPSQTSTGTSYEYYTAFKTPSTAAESATNPCPGGTRAIQGGRVRRTTSADPDGGGSLTAPGPGGQVRRCRPGGGLAGCGRRRLELYGL